MPQRSPASPAIEADAKDECPTGVTYGQEPSEELLDRALSGWERFLGTLPGAKG
ncbi:hypothetical protein ACIRP0_16955 [Streptomyces sp. NPDC101733]|uniref:hypothetical protein n=1 Tax=unclassified Streptomyces TaxID=2593676 RepID=UPI0037FE9852